MFNRVIATCLTALIVACSAPPRERIATNQDTGPETVAVKSGWYCSPGSEDDAVQLNLAIAHGICLPPPGM